MLEKTLQFFILAAAFTTGHTALAYPAAICAEAFDVQAPVVHKRREPETVVDLFQLRDAEIGNLSPSTIRWMNKQALDAFVEVMPPVSKTQSQMIDTGRLRRLIEVEQEHVVISNEASKKYSPAEVDIGYCFGRATYSHLMVKRMGLQESSIRKVWAIGPMRSPSGDIIWDFHVATAVFTPEGWMTIDPLTYKAEPVRHWLSRFEGQSIDGRMRFYVTEASKFAPALGRYDRTQLGLDLPREEDWYRHFFPDMFATIRSADLEQLGLSKMKPNSEPDSATPANESLWQTWKRLFGF